MLIIVVPSNHSFFQKYQTKKHLKENERIRRKGFYGNQRARNEDGYTSLRDTKQFHEIGHHLRLSTEWAQNPGHDPRFFKRTRLSGKVKMFFANKGIDFSFSFSMNHTVRLISFESYGK